MPIAKLAAFLDMVSKKKTLRRRKSLGETSIPLSWGLQIALVAARLGQFCENFENTRETVSLILLGLMRLHMLKIS